MSGSQTSLASAEVLPDDPQQLAELAARAMYAKDPATQALGVRLLEVGPGHARMSMKVRADMLNGHQTCHGGFIFALADSTFAFACNSRNQATVASGCTIDFLAPGFEGDELTADAAERARRRQQELESQGTVVPFEEIYAQIVERDARDSGRAVAPLLPAHDAVLIDTSTHEIDEVVDELERHVRSAEARRP